MHTHTQHEREREKKLCAPCLSRCQLLNASENIIKQAVVKVFKYLKIQFFIASGFVFVHATVIFCLLFFKLCTFLRCGLVYATQCVLCTVYISAAFSCWRVFAFPISSYRLAALGWSVGRKWTHASTLPGYGWIATHCAKREQTYHLKLFSVSDIFT